MLCQDYPNAARLEVTTIAILAERLGMAAAGRFLHF